MTVLHARALLTANPEDSNIGAHSKDALRGHPSPALQSAVFLNDYCHINGGASRVAIDEAVALARSGVDVTFLGASGPICAELSDSPVKVVCLEQTELIDAGRKLGVYVQALWNLPAYKAMRKILSGLDPATTVVHLHGYTKSLTTSPVRAAAKSGFSVVCTLHDFFIACPNGALFDYVANEPCGRVGQSFDCLRTACDKRAYAHKVYRYARSALQHWPGRLPDGVRHYISLSTRSAELLRPYLPADARVHPLENIVDIPHQPPADVGSHRKIVAVGRLDREKGCELLVEAAEQAGVDITFVGDGALREKLEKSPRVKITGWLSPQQVQKELDGARALVFASLWYETYGLVVAEAAARGVPAVASDISAAAERMQHGVHGLVFKAGNAESLAACLRQLDDDAAVARMGAAAYAKFWQAPPTAQRHSEGLRSLYGSILASRSAA